MGQADERIGLRATLHRERYREADVVVSIVANEGDKIRERGSGNGKK